MRRMQRKPTWLIEGSLETLSNALFIPAFFVAAGFLIDFRIFAETMIDHPLLVVGIVGGLFVGSFSRLDVRPMYSGMTGKT